MRSFLIKSSFQHSSIPLFHVGGNTQQPQKTFLISISCTNSETLNYQFLLTFIIICLKKILTAVAGSYKEKGKSKKARKAYIRTMIKIPFWFFFSKIDNLVKSLNNMSFRGKREILPM